MPNASIIRLSRFVLSYRRRLIGWRIARMGLLIATALFLFVASLQVIFAFFPWTFLPLLLDAAVGVAAIFFLTYTGAVTTFLSPGVIAIARLIEARCTGKRPLLSLSLELAADPTTRDNPFTNASIARAVADLPAYPQAPIPPRHHLLLSAAALLLGLWCGTSPLLSPKLIDYWSLPFTRFSKQDAQVRPGTITVRTGATVDLTLDLKGAKHPSSRLSIVAEDGRRSSLLLRPDANGCFSYRLDSITVSALYRFSSGSIVLDPETLTVAPRPRLQRLAVTVIPPAYTKKAARALPEAQGNFDAYIGSRARFTLTARRLAKAWIVMENDTVPFTVTGDNAYGEIPVNKPLAYTFRLLDTLDQKNDSLPLFHISAIRDEPPLVQIVKPGFNKALEPQQVETLHVEGVDDIGLGALALAWRLSGERAGTIGRRDFPIMNGAAVFGVSFVWRLSDLSLYPGDTAYYWAEATDTRPGGQRGYSDTFWFRIPSFQERFAQRSENQDNAEKTLGAVRDKQGEIGEELENLMKAASRKNDLSWEQKQILRDIKKELEAQSDSIGKALQSLQKTVEQLKQEGTIGEEISKKFEEVRKAVDDLTKKYGDSLLFSLKDMEKPVSWREMRNAIQKVQSMLPRLDQELDNVLKFLEMLKQDQKLSELAMRAEQLAKEQEALSKSDRSPEAKMDRQKELLDAIQQLEKDAGEAVRRPDEALNPFDSLQSKQLLDSLRKAMGSTLSQRRPPSGGTMNQMSGALSSMSQDLMQMMNFNLAGRMEKERQALLSLSRDALSLADWQQELLHENASGDFADRARGEQALKDALKKSLAEADKLSMTPPDQMAAIGRGFKDALSSVEDVLGALGSNDGSGPMVSSSASLRSLANALLSALSKLENGQQSSCNGGACMLPGLRRLSGRQAAINAMTADLLRQMMRGAGNGEGMQPGEGGGEAAQQARRAAQQAQQAIADQLQQLAEKYGKEAGESMRSRVGDLEEEARRMAAMLSRPTAEITERQDRFLARMLETTLSMHRQGEGKEEWKSRTAEKTMSEVLVSEPGKAFKDVDAFHLLRQKAFNGNFPEAYRAALRAYFEALSERYLK